MAIHRTPIPKIALLAERGGIVSSRKGNTQPTTKTESTEHVQWVSSGQGATRWKATGGREHHQILGGGGG